MRTLGFIIVFSCMFLWFFSGPVMAQAFRMPWEDEKAKAPVINPDKIHDVKVVRDSLEIIRLPAGGKIIISSAPEVANLYLRDPDMLFIVGRLRGSTSVVVADEGLAPVWSGSVIVTDIEEEEE